MWIEVHNNGARPPRYTYRCVVLPDAEEQLLSGLAGKSQCTYRCVVLPDALMTALSRAMPPQSQCTYRCVVLPDGKESVTGQGFAVSMHLQVRGAP